MNPMMHAFNKTRCANFQRGKFERAKDIKINCYLVLVL